VRLVRILGKCGKRFEPEPERIVGAAATTIKPARVGAYVRRRTVIREITRETHSRLLCGYLRPALLLYPCSGDSFMNRKKITHSGAGTAIAALLSGMTFAGVVLAGDGNAAPAQTAVSAQTSDAASSLSKPNTDRDELRIKELHDRLKIAPDQETLWNNVAQIMRGNDEKIDGLAKERHDKAPTMTAVEDLRSYGAITEAHATGIRTFVPAFEKLYESMSAEQKANADNVFRTAGRKSHKKAM
jgi:LTXXQ motif family protein